MKHTAVDLAQMQSLPLSAKIRMTERRIRDWYDAWDGNVYISFSGGKDSTVLMDLVRNIYPEVEAVFVNTGLEYPEIQQFVKTFDNVTILRPKMRFDEVIKKYGYPIISKETSKLIKEGKTALKKGNMDYYAIQKLEGRLKDKKGNKSIYNCEKYYPLLDMDFKISNSCCDVMKKRPFHKYEKISNKKPYIGIMASESKQRFSQWLQNGCNAFDKKNPNSAPLSFWTEQDILQYIKDNDLKISKVYGSIEYIEDPEQIRWSEIDENFLKFESKEVKALTTTGCKRTGCIFCGFGCHLEKNPNRFERLKETHPNQYKYCIEGGEYNEGGMWQPNKKGLGMAHVFDELNQIYGEEFIKYK